MTRSPRTKHTMWLREGDMEFLKSRFPAIGGSAVIRAIVSDFVDKLDRPIEDNQVAELVREIEADAEA